MNEPRETWPAPWKGEVLLACRKCQKKLRKHGPQPALGRLSKAVKQRNRAHREARLHVISVPCMKLCPKHAVTICRPAEDAERLFILESESDIDALFD